MDISWSSSPATAAAVRMPKDRGSSALAVDSRSTEAGCRSPARREPGRRRQPRSDSSHPRPWLHDEELIDDRLADVGERELVAVERPADVLRWRASALPALGEAAVDRRVVPGLA